MNDDDLKPGKRYWFYDREYVYSGLYGGEKDRHNRNRILTRRNGDTWSVPAEDIFESKEEVIKAMCVKKYVLVDR